MTHEYTTTQQLASTEAPPVTFGSTEALPAVGGKRRARMTREDYVQMWADEDARDPCLNTERVPLFGAEDDEVDDDGDWCELCGAPCVRNE